MIGTCPAGWYTCISALIYPPLSFSKRFEQHHQQSMLCLQRNVFVTVIVLLQRILLFYGCFTTFGIIDSLWTISGSLFISTGVTSPLAMITFPESKCRTRTWNWKTFAFARSRPPAPMSRHGSPGCWVFQKRMWDSSKGQGFGGRNIRNVMWSSNSKQAQNVRGVCSVFGFIKNLYVFVCRSQIV